jgi:hypothetical protein
MDLGFLSSLGIILWLPFITMGTLTITVYSVYLGYSYLGFGVFVGANCALAAYLNKARKHGRADAFDDRLSSQKMDDARNWWTNKNNGETEN